MHRRNRCSRTRNVKRAGAHPRIQGVPKLTLDILKADSLANLKTIFPQRKCRGTNSFRVIND